MKMSKQPKSQEPTGSGIRTTLLSQNWKFWYLCHCGGSERQSYTHPDKTGYEFQVRPTKQTFMIIHKGLILAGPYPSYLLQKHMEKLNIWK